jgi:hypothetical protein
MREERRPNMINLSKDWPAYFFTGLSIWFFVYVGYKNRQHEKNKKEQK